MDNEQELANCSPSPRKRSGPQYVRRKRSHPSLAPANPRALKLKFKEHSEPELSEVIGMEESTDDDRKHYQASAGSHTHLHQRTATDKEEFSVKTRDILFWSSDEDEEEEDMAQKTGRVLSPPGKAYSRRKLDHQAEDGLKRKVLNLRRTPAEATMHPNNQRTPGRKRRHLRLNEDRPQPSRKVPSRRDKTVKLLDSELRSPTCQRSKKQRVMEQAGHRRTRKRSKPSSHAAESEESTKWFPAFDRIGEEPEIAEGEDPYDFNEHVKRKEAALHEEEEEVLAFLGKHASAHTPRGLERPRNVFDFSGGSEDEDERGKSG